MTPKQITLTTGEPIIDTDGKTYRRVWRKRGRSNIHITPECGTRWWQLNKLRLKPRTWVNEVYFDGEFLARTRGYAFGHIMIFIGPEYASYWEEVTE